MPGATGILLAAGEGRRMGRPKALVTAGDGTAWGARAVGTLLAGGCADVLVVVGAEAEQVRLTLPEDPRVQVVECRDWREGMGASLRAGLTALAGRGAAVPDTAVVHLVDLPDVGPDVVSRVLGRAGSSPAALARAAYQGVPGHPVLLGREHWDPVTRSAGGDQGARSYLRTHRPLLVECGDLAAGADVDRPPAR